MTQGGYLRSLGTGGAGLAVAEALLAFAKATSIYPVSSDVAIIKADVILRVTAFLGVVLAIYGHCKIRHVTR